MPWLKFNKKYDHTWPSRAMTCWPEGYVGFVKREVAERAIEKGAAEIVDRPTGEPADTEETPQSEAVDTSEKSG